MPTPACPHCAAAPRYLPYSSSHSSADYYRCDGCGFVFTLDRSNPDGPYQAVTRNEPAHPDSDDGGSDGSATS